MRKYNILTVKDIIYCNVIIGDINQVGTWLQLRWY